VVSTSVRVAETVKLFENVLRSASIGLINEMSMMSDRIIIDMWEIVAEALTKPIGLMSCRD